MHRGQPGWGPGRVLCISGNLVRVGFRHFPGSDGAGVRMRLSDGWLQIHDDQQADAGDGWPSRFDHACNPVRSTSGKSSITTVTWEQAWHIFLAAYPEGFHDARYMEEERAWKWERHVEWTGRVGDGPLAARAAEDLPSLAAQLQRLVQTRHAPLLDRKTELPVLGKALALEEPARAYFGALDALVAADDGDEAAFTGLTEAVAHMLREAGTSRVHTWPVVTAAPFLIRPDRFLFVKPDPMRRAGRLLGHELAYRAQPNWQTYSRIMDLGRRLLAHFQDRGARDFLDVQSFLWVLARHKEGA